MSHTLSPSAPPTARDVRRLLRGATARLSDKTERGPDRRVRRDSYDVDDRRAQVSQPIGDGTAAGALGWIDCLLRVVSDWDDMERRKGGARPLGLAGLRVLEALLGRRGRVAVDFKTGRLDPAIDTIAAAARLTRTTVIRALARLKALRILDWVRRTQKTDNAGQCGPQREQVTNSYWFTTGQLPARVRQRLRDLVARKRIARQARAGRPPEPEKPIAPFDPALRASLERLGQSLQDASPPSGQYPRSGSKG